MLTPVFVVSKIGGVITEGEENKTGEGNKGSEAVYGLSDF